jgi:hypothetical protein
MTRSTMGKKFSVALLMTGALLLPASPAFGAPPSCDDQPQGCKTVDDPDKSNPKFTESQRGNLDAEGTESTCTGANNGQTKQVCGD